jgi:hypothetical protein
MINLIYYKIMNSKENLDLYGEEPLASVSLEFLNTKTNPQLLYKLLQSVRKAPNLKELQHRLGKASGTLKGLDIYKNCDIGIYPGASLDTAIARFDFKEHNMLNWDMKFFPTNKGMQAALGLKLRNLTGHADITRFNVNYLLNSKSIIYDFRHYDQLLSPGKLRSLIKLEKGMRGLDSNVMEDKYGGGVYLISADKVHTLGAGRFIRTNIFNPDYASQALLNEIPVSSLNFLSYLYTCYTLDSLLYPRKGVHLLIRNQVAYGDARYHKLDIHFSRYLALNSQLILESSLLFGMFTPFEMAKTFFNDRYRTDNIKGFRSIGAREPPCQAFASENPNFIGDEMGKLSLLQLEAKLHLCDLPLLRSLHVAPFVYGNLVLADPLKMKFSYDDAVNEVRGSYGVGLRINTFLGRIEISYTTRTFSKPGDLVAAGTQVTYHL